MNHLMEKFKKHFGENAKCIINESHEKIQVFLDDLDPTLLMEDYHEQDEIEIKEANDVPPVWIEKVSYEWLNEERYEVCFFTGEFVEEEIRGKTVWQPEFEHDGVGFPLAILSLTLEPAKAA